MSPGVVLPYSCNTVEDIGRFLSTQTDTTTTSPKLQAVPLKVCGYMCVQHIVQVYIKYLYFPQVPLQAGVECGVHVMHHLGIFAKVFTYMHSVFNEFNFP